MKLMAPLLPTLVLTAALSGGALHAAMPKVVYGEDNRVFVEESTNPLYQKLAVSTAVQIKNNKISEVPGGLFYSVDPEKLSESFMNVCEDEDYADVINAGNCSGFLVGEDLLVTAGHCMRSVEDCENGKWAFNYEASVLGDGTLLPAKDVYSCAEIVNQSLDYLTRSDFALIKLDRKVKDRAPLVVRKEGSVAVGTELVVIGHPSGLPKVIADGAQVRNFKDDWFFKANLDTFGGNSGSAVFNAETGIVEGILVRGTKDYYFDASSGCNRVYKCADDGCRGEDVTRITVIPELAPGMTPERPAPELSPEQIAILSFFGM